LLELAGKTGRDPAGHRASKVVVGYQSCRESGPDHTQARLFCRELRNRLFP